MVKVALWSMLSITLAIAFIFSTQIFTTFEAETVGPAVSVVRSQIDLVDETLLIEFRNIGGSADSVTSIFLPGTGTIPIQGKMIPANSDSTILIIDLSVSNPNIIQGQVISFQIKMGSGILIPSTTLVE